MRRLRIGPEHAFFGNVWRMLETKVFDVVHSYHFYDSLASTLQQRRGKPHRSVVQLNGVPVPGVSCRRRFPPEALMIGHALRHADRVIACSAFVRDMIRCTFGAEASVIPPPLDASMWPLGKGEREDPPVVLAVGNFAERRKGLRVLLRAFELLKHDMPRLILRVSGNCGDLRDQLMSETDPRAGRDIQFLGLGNPEDIPKLYQSASVLVLPSMWEPSGTVMMEAWLSGTPVVATRHGGLPELFADGVGLLFDPESEGEEAANAHGLVVAIGEALVLAKDPAARVLCRAHGMTFST
jgi:glycosyltransferase involved in cell wall biosynthesis